MPKIDTEKLKGAVDMVELASKYTDLRPVASQEFAGPCPICGGNDRFHVHVDGWFFCRQCYPVGNGQSHDAIALVCFSERLSFKEAVERLSGDPWQASKPIAVSMPSPKPERVEVWRSVAWQAQAQAEVEAAALRLLSKPEGLKGRQYLEYRGLHRSTWKAFDLGLSLVYGAAFISLPWQHDGTLFAVRLRRIGGQGDKLSSYPVGGQYRNRLFGLDRLTGAAALLLVEGEINCLSVWQQAQEHGWSLDCASFGSGAGLGDRAIDLARKYGKVISWHDREAEAQQARQRLQQAGCTVRSLVSIEENGVQQDCNELMQQGRLREAIQERL